MELSKLNNHFSSEGKPTSRKSVAKIPVIFILIGIAFAMIGVWGRVSTCYFTDTQGFRNSLPVGIEAYLYGGWKYLSSNQLGAGNYICFIILILMFIANLAITYFLGIRTFVVALRNMANKDDISIMPYFIIIALSNLAYFMFGAALSSAIFSLRDISSGWGAKLVAFGLVPAVGVTAVMNIIFSFEKEKISDFIARIFFTVTIIIIIAVIGLTLDGYFSSGYDYSGIAETFGIAFAKYYSSSAAGFYIAHGVVQMLICAVAFVTLIQTIYTVLVDYPVNKKWPLILPIVLFALVSFELFTNAYSQELLDPNVTINVNSNAINAFVISFIILTIDVTNYLIVNKKA